MSERIIEANLLEQYKKDAVKYAIYVSRERITCDFRDGLKPVQRKIVYGMYEKGYVGPSKIKKSADTVGHVMAKYHPHSNDSIYGAMGTMANWYSIKLPLIYPSGNWGSIMGDGPAAMRYTECALSNFSADCVLRDLSENEHAVDWMSNYDDSTKEPAFLAPGIPLLLINGTTGIGVGMKTDIPRHNLVEVIDATLRLIDNPNAQVVLVPDLCMPCEIIDTDFKKISNHGFGTFQVRAIIEETTYKGYPALVVRSLPDYTTLDTIQEKIESLVESKQILQIKDTFDKSDNNHVEYIIQLKQGADTGYVKDMLYKHTKLQDTCRVNFEVLEGLKLMRMSYKAYLLAFIEFRKLTKFRLHTNEVQEYKTRFHRIDAFIKVIESGEIDFIYNSIRKRKDTDDTALIEYLIKKIGLTDLQAEFIINCDFKKLSIGYLNKYKAEAADLTIKINDLMNKILDDRFIVEEIKAELLEYRSKYGSPRLCKVIKASDANNIPQGEFIVLVTNNNFIKKIPVSDNLLSYKDDGVRCIGRFQNSDSLLLFDERGKVLKVDTHKVPMTAKNQSGTDLRLLNKYIGANIMKIYSVQELEAMADSGVDWYFVIISKNGNIKKIDLADVIATSPSGILYTKLDDNDVVKEVLILNNSHEVMVYSDKKAIKLSVANIPYLKRNTKGSSAMRNADEIDGMSYIDNHSDAIIITTKGKINRINAIAIPKNERGGSGTNVIKLGKGDKIHSIRGAVSGDILRVGTINNGKIDIPIDEIPMGSSVSAGVPIIPAKDTIIKTEIIKG